jgi:hypothetical protein
VIGFLAVVVAMSLSAGARGRRGAGKTKRQRAA